MSNQDENIEEWVLSFHGTSYIINLLANDVLLTLEVEDEDSGERWSGEFTAQCKSRLYVFYHLSRPSHTDIEEITHKAGNFKKFSLFIKMLSSAFSKNTDCVYVDLLTLADLEMMKAKKLGNPSSISSSSAAAAVPAAVSLRQISSQQQQRKNSLKRYAILTYTGEFDRVHYPLPLAFEETPNVVSLQRTIRRLRERLKEKDSEHVPPASEKERELRQIVPQLRQENQELKHQLRQLLSRSGKRSSSQTRSSATNSPSHSVGSSNMQDSHSQLQITDHLSAQNLKLKKQLDELKKQFSDLSFQYEKSKVDSAKELARWQQKLGIPALSTLSPSKNNHNSISPPTQSKLKTDTQIIAALQQRILLLERELKLQKLSRGVPTSRSATPNSVTSAHSRENTSVNRRAVSASLSTKESAKKRSNFTRSFSPSSVHSNNSHRSLATAESRSHTITPSNRKIANENLRSKPPRPHQNQSINMNRLTARQTGSLDETAERSRAHSNPSSSSLGGKFDPTAYQQRRKQQLSTSRTPSPVHSKDSRRRDDSPLDSGYSSANSQGSRGSRLSELSADSRRTSAKEGKRKSKKTGKQKGRNPIEPFDDHKKTVSRELFDERKGKNPELVQQSTRVNLIHEVSRQLDDAMFEKGQENKKTSNTVAEKDRRNDSKHFLEKQRRGFEARNENFVNYNEGEVGDQPSSLSSNNPALALTGYQQFEERVNLIRRSLDGDRDHTYQSHTNAHETGTRVQSQLSAKSHSILHNSRDLDEELDELTTTNTSIPELNQRISALSAYLEKARKVVSSSYANRSSNLFSAGTASLR